MSQKADSAVTDQRDRTVLWYSILITGVVAASASATIIKVLHQERVPWLIIGASRNFVACICLLPFFLAGKWRQIVRLDLREKGLVVISGVILGFHFAMWIISLQYTSVASATIFVTTTPIFVVLGSHYILGEKVSPLIFIGIIISVIGGVLVVGADFGQFAGDVIALLGAIAVSAYILIGRKVRPKLHLVAYTFVVYSIAGITLALAAFAVGDSFFGYSTRAYTMMVLLGLISSLIGHTSINFVLRHLRSYIVSVAILGEPVSATLLAFAFLGEIPEWLEVIGCAVMLLGIYLSIKYSSTD